MLNQDNHRDADVRTQRGRFYFPQCGSILESCTKSIAWISYAMKTQSKFVIARSGATKPSILSFVAQRIASRSLSSGAHSRDPLARNDAVVVTQISPPV
jgi:hypothetical protein